jgi:ankyrin repeat protein
MLLATGRVFPDPRTENGVTPLHLAAKHGDLPLARLLVKSGADVNAVSNRQFTPLAFAVTGQHLEIVKYLLTLPEVDLNTKTADHVAPLSIAITANSMRIARLLLADDRVDVNDFLGPAFFAAKHSRTAVFGEIVSKQNFDWAMRGPNSETILHLLCADARLDLLKIVLSRGAEGVDVNALDDVGQSALSRACALGSSRVVRELLRIGRIDVNHADGVGWTALHYACNAGAVDAVIPLLMRPEMDINAMTRAGMKPLHMIVLGGLVDALTAICWRTDLDVNALSQTTKPLTALMIAAHMNRPDLMRILLNYPGIDPYLKSPCGNSAFRIACKRRFLECAKLVERVVETPPAPVKVRRRATLVVRGSAGVVV